MFDKFLTSKSFRGVTCKRTSINVAQFETHLADLFSYQGGKSAFKYRLWLFLNEFYLL